MSTNSVNSTQNGTGPVYFSPITLGLSGAGIGALCGAKRPELKQILELKPDTFEAIVKDTTGEARNAADTIKAELNTLSTYKPNPGSVRNFETALTNHIVTDQKLLNDLILIDEKLNQNKQIYDNLVLDKVNETLAPASQYKKLADVPQQRIQAAKNALQNSEILEEIKAGETAIRETKIKSMRKAGDDATKQILNAYDTAIETAKTNKKNKIAELTKNEDLTKAFGKIKKLFPKKGRWNAALKFGGIAALAAILANIVSRGISKN